MAADELRVTNVKDFRDAVHEILDAPPPSSTSNLWHLGRVVFVDVKGRDLGRPRPEAPHCSLVAVTSADGKSALSKIYNFCKILQIILQIFGGLVLGWSCAKEYIV